jgi:hypothetical protein
MSATRLDYARAIIQALHAPRKPETEMSLVAVMVAEGSRAAWNPLDTTLQWHGATPYNDFGPNGEYHVWNYPDAQSGVAATVSTMLQPNMKVWIDAIRKGTLKAEDICLAFSRVPWGGIGDRLPLEVVQAWRTRARTYVRDAKTEVWGNGPWPFTRTGKPA